MVQSGFFGAPGRFPSGRWQVPRGGRQYVGGGELGRSYLPLGRGGVEAGAPNGFEALRIIPKYQEPISVIPSGLPLVERPKTVQGDWSPLQEDPSGLAAPSMRSPSYRPGQEREMPRLSSSLASLIEGTADVAQVVDPAMAGPRTRRDIFRGTVLPQTEDLPRRYASRGLIPAPRDRGLGLDQDPSLADFYREYLSEAPRTPLYRDRLSMDYSGGQEVERFPVDWNTGLPSDAPIYTRGRFGSDFDENQKLSSDGLGFRSQAPETVSLKPKAIGVEAAPYTLEPIVVLGANGITRREVVDPRIAVDQESPNPDSTALWERTRDVLLGERVQSILEEAKTPIMPRSALIKAYQDGRFQPLPEDQRVGTLIGYLSPSGGQAQAPKPVYAPMDGDEPLTVVRDVAKRGPYGSYVDQVAEQLYRIGSPLNRDDEFIRGELRNTPKLQVVTRTAPQVDRPINIGALQAKTDEGYRVVSADTPLFSLTPEGLKARVSMLQGRPAVISEETGRPVNSFAGRLDVYRDDRLLQSIVPEVDQGGSYTGRFLPLQAQEEGPSFLASSTLQRIKGEEFGSRRAGLTGSSAGLEGTLGRLGKGAFMQAPRTADGVRDVLAPMIISGQLTAEQIQQDPRLSHLFRPGSHARRILEQEVLSVSGGATRLPAGPQVVLRADAPTAPSSPSSDWRPWINQPIQTQPAIYSPQSQLELNFSGQSLQKEAAKRILRQTAQTSLPVQAASSGYSPSYIDEVAAYMAQRGQSPRPLSIAAQEGPRAAQLELFPNRSVSSPGRYEPTPVIPIPRSEMGVTQEDIQALGLLAMLSSRNRLMN